MLGKLVVLLIGITGVTNAAARAYGGLNPTAIESAQLPKYCYAQYVDTRLAADPKYSIQGCGVWMNHFCPGLLQLMRAEKVSSPRSTRADNLHGATENFEYTLKHMPAGCWLRHDAESALSRARAMRVFLK